MPLWNERRPTADDHRLFDRVVETHLLTQQWLKDIAKGPDDSAHLLARADIPQASKHQQWLSRWSPHQIETNGLEELLQQSDTDQILAELNVSVNAIQVWCLNTWLSQASKNEQAALVNQLEQSSWKAGQDSFHRRWPNLTHGRMDDFTACAEWSPFGGFLRKRLLPDAMDLEWVGCPHTLGTDAALADVLCSLQAHWWRGFAYAYSPSFQLIYVKGSPCRLEGGIKSLSQPS